MLPILFDEDFNGRIIRGLRRLAPHLDVIRVQDAGFAGFDDRDLLAWAAGKGRVIASHDVNTMSAFAGERLANQQPMAGLILASHALSIGLVIEELRLIAECSALDDFEGMIFHLPL